MTYPFRQSTDAPAQLLLTYVPDSDTPSTRPETSLEGTATINALTATQVEGTVLGGAAATMGEAMDLLSTGPDEAEEPNPESLTLRRLFLRILHACPPERESRARAFLQLLARSIRRCEWRRALRVINENRPELPEVDAVEGLIYLSMKEEAKAEPFLEKAARNGPEPLRRYTQAMLVRIHREEDHSSPPPDRKPREYKRPGTGATPSNRTEGRSKGFRMFVPGEGNVNDIMREVGTIVAAIEAVEAKDALQSSDGRDEPPPIDHPPF
jgi:hypothetical protein